MSRETVIRRIVERETKRQTLIEEWVLQDAPDLHRAACDHFGAWETAMHYAGISERRWRVRYSSKRIISWLRHLKKDRYSLKATHVQQREPKRYRDALRLFGSWTKALHAAGVASAQLTKSPEQEDVLAELRAWNNEGHSLRMCDIYAQHRRLACAVRRQFGCWTKAILALGYTKQQLSKSCTTWNHALIISFIRNRRQQGKPLELEHVCEEDAVVIWAARHYFGSWECALHAAAEAGANGEAIDGTP